MRRIRVRAENGERYTQMLRDAGHEARWCGAGSASSALMGGCCDPGCCEQHDAKHNPMSWGAIETDVSGTAAHKIWSNHD
jgi:hypothetical protein